MNAPEVIRMKLLVTIRKRFQHLAGKIRSVRFNNRIILVYSMGKVGSSTVYHSIKRIIPFASVHHVHFLSDYWLKDRLPTSDGYFHRNIKIGKDIREYINRHPTRRLKIITLVREPIIRDISSIFENQAAFFARHDDVNIKALHEIMSKHDHSYSLNWFDTEFKNFLDFDIYSLPFDRERGYSMYNLAKADVLCIRLEDLNRVYKRAFKDFLGLDNLTLIDKNKSDSKGDISLYKQLRASYKVKRERLNGLYSSKYVAHFYTSHEIAKFIRKWS